MNAFDADQTDPKSGAEGKAGTFKSLTATVANALQRDLVDGRYMPGHKLPIVRLAKSYGVSPGAVREALSRLISEGLVEFNEQRGFRAAPVSRAALMDITRTRIMIDVHALREAIRLGDVDWEAEVLAIHHRLANCVPRDDSDSKIVREEWQRLHRIFHRTLISACGSTWLMRFHDLLFDQTIRYRSIASAYEVQREDLRRDPNKEHAEIVRATVARDADAAAALLQQHYYGTAQRLSEGQAGTAVETGDTRRN
jgi:DNA-binding GntR family transcriptional regulator